MSDFSAHQSHKSPADAYKFVAALTASNTIVVTHFLSLWERVGDNDAEWFSCVPHQSGEDRRKKEYFLNSRSTSALSQRGESYFTLSAHYFPGSRLLAKFIGSKKN